MRHLPLLPPEYWKRFQLMTPDRHGHLADAFVKSAGGAFDVAVALIILVMAERYKPR